MKLNVKDIQELQKVFGDDLSHVLDENKALFQDKFKQLVDLLDQEIEKHQGLLTKAEKTWHDEVVKAKRELLDYKQRLLTINTARIAEDVYSSFKHIQSQVEVLFDELPEKIRTATAATAHLKAARDKFETLQKEVDKILKEEELQKTYKSLQKLLTQIQREAISDGLVKVKADIENRLKIGSQRLDQYTKAQLSAIKGDLEAHVGGLQNHARIEAQKILNEFKSLENKLNHTIKNTLHQFDWKDLDKGQFPTNLRNIITQKLGNFDPFINEVNNLAKEVKNVEWKLRNRVDTYGQEIAYTANEIKNKFEDKTKEIEESINQELSDLRSDYIDWKGDFLKNAVLQAIGEDNLKLIKAYEKTYKKLIKDLPDKKSIEHLLTLEQNKAKSELGKIEAKLTGTAKDEFVKFKNAVVGGIGATNTEDFKRKLMEEFSSLPIVEEAQVYIDSINKVVKEDLPLKIKYAEDFLEDQKEQIELNFEKNVSKVFAQVAADTQEVLRGKMRNVAKDLGGFVNPEIPVEYLTMLQDPKKAEKELRREIEQHIPPEAKQLGKDMVLMSNKAKDLYNEYRKLSPKAVFDGLKTKILGDINLQDILGDNFSIPNTKIVDGKAIYLFKTSDISNLNLGPFSFYNKGGRGNSASMVIQMSRSLTSSEYSSYTRLSNFSVGILNKSLLIIFDRFEVKKTSSSKQKTDVRIRDVSFGGPLNFIGKLAEQLKMPGNGLRVLPSAREIEIGYTFGIPNISMGTFSMQNIKFDIGLLVPIPNGEEVAPMMTIFSINFPHDKFLITVWIFGGRGHLVMYATPRELQKVDAALEFGGYLGLNLGIAKGYAYLFAGIRYVFTRNDGAVRLSAYLVCSGGVTVFGFISVSVTFRMALIHRKAGKKELLYGSASVRYSVKVGFFKKSFTLRYKKVFKSKGGKQVDPNETAYVDYGEPMYASTTDLVYPEAIIEDGGLAKEEGNLPEFYDEEAKVDYTKKDWENYFNSFDYTT